ncbi:hypothetical protein niasHT_033379 [Heterodera trifolii]|uniref:G-protein coupled receptors family 1 profile domain-containing protein n=1 Tax=Heterodera trifolii TaxID=157864 RepID=A0ABD2HQU5_9BILA
MESAFGMILDLGYSISFFVVLSGTKFVRYEHCFMYLIVPCLCGDLAQIVMVFTGIDRVCAVAFPFWYKQRSKEIFAGHFSMHLLLSVLRFYNFLY